MIYENQCVNLSCFGHKAQGSNLCVKCRDLCHSTLVVGVCLGMCALIIALARLGRMI